MGQGPKLFPDKGIYTCNHAHTTGLYTKNPYKYAHRPYRMHTQPHEYTNKKMHTSTLNIHTQPRAHNHMNIHKKTYKYAQINGNKATR